MREKFDLNGKWQFRENGTGEWLSGVVPGCVELDLMRLEMLPDPYYGMNEVRAQRLEEKEWTYRKEFNFSHDTGAFDAVEIVFQGVDTFSEIYLNGRYVGKTENMFIPHRFSIEDQILKGRNLLEVRLESTIRVARRLEKNSADNLGYCCESAFPYIRKAHFSSGWDWCPRLLQTGIWRPVYIEAGKVAAIRDPFFHTTELSGNQATIRVQGEVIVYRPDEYAVEVAVFLQGNLKARKTVDVKAVKKANGFCVDMSLPDASVWWPNGAGGQPLYDIQLSLVAAGSCVDKHHFQSGVRTAKLVRERDEDGESFLFEINGKRIFAKGANWTPGDNYLPRFDETKQRRYVEMAKEANMNMLLVWGGGVYENEAFYRACDEMGIMVWQTFMFHFAEYPAYADWFTSLVKKEADSVIRQLRNHPSIVLWCGDCESLWAYPSEDKYRGEYIYKELLAEACTRLDPSRDYRVSNPYGGADPNSMSEGDRHSYDAYIGWQDFDLFKQDTSRFVSEFGVQSMPCWKTLLWYTPKEERHLLSPTVLCHSKFPDGIERITRYMVSRLGFPQNLQSFVYLSQFNQAEAVKMAVEHWRSSMFHCGGTLYWQLLDSWPGTTFSSVDYFQRKKALYFYAKRFYAEILPILRPEDTYICLSIVSDMLRDARVDVKITSYSMDGTKLGEKQFPSEVQANTCTKVKEIQYEELGIAYESRLLAEDLRYTNIVKEKNGRLLDAVIFVDIEYQGKTFSNYAVFERFRNLRISKPDIKIRCNGRSITLRSDVPVFGLFIETEKDIELSDNCLFMKPLEVYTVECSYKPGDIQHSSLFDMVSPLV